MLNCAPYYHKLVSRALSSFFTMMDIANSISAWTWLNGARSRETLKSKSCSLYALPFGDGVEWLRVQLKSLYHLGNSQMHANSTMPLTFCNLKQVHCAVSTFFRVSAGCTFGIFGVLAKKLLSFGWIGNATLYPQQRNLRDIRKRLLCEWFCYGSSLKLLSVYTISNILRLTTSYL